MEKRHLLFLAVAGIFWFAWMRTIERFQPPRKPAAQKGLHDAKQVKAAPAAKDPKSIAKEGVDNAAEKKRAVAKTQVKPAKPAAPLVPLIPSIPLGTGDGTKYELVADLTNRGATVNSVILNNYKNETRTAPLMLIGSTGPASYALDLVDNDGEPLSDRRWSTERKENEIVFRTVALDGKLEIEKKFSLPEHSNIIELDVRLKNLSAEPLTGVAYTLTGPSGLPIEGKWYTRFFRNFFVSMIPSVGRTPFYAEETSKVIADKENNGTKQTLFENSPIQFAGIVVQYFASLVIQRENASSGRLIQSVTPTDVTLVPNVKPDLHDISATFQSAPVTLAPQKEVVQRFLLFNGPKKEEVLAQFSEYHLDQIHHYYDTFFLPIGPVARFMVGILNFFYSLVGDYGVAIILLTVTVRSAMFPLSLRQAKSMQKMQALAPRMQELKEKYADDKEKLNRAMMDLYAKEKINPLGGCLPLVLQFPVFIGLYQALSNSFNLRQSSFLYGLTWINDLAAPDMMFRWGENVPLVSYYLGPYFNLLPILATGQMLLQMHLMSPPATTPEAQLQKRMMTFMSLFMSFLFYNVPSGLCIYMLTTMSWSLAERQLLPKPPTPTPGSVVAAPKSKSEEASWRSPVEKKKKKSRF